MRKETQILRKRGEGGRMINSGRAVAILALVFLCLGGFVAYAGWKVASGNDGPGWSISLGVGLVTTLIVFIFWLVSMKAWRQTARLMRPEMQISRWQINLALWEAFRAAEASLLADPNGLPNLLPLGRFAPSGPIEVIAAKGGMLIGGRLFPMEPRGMLALRQVRWLQGVPELLELVLFETTMINTGSSGRSQTRWVSVRMPVAPSQREAAIAAYQHYTAFEAADMLSNPRPTRIAVRVAFVLGLIGLSLGALGVWMDTNGIMANSLTPALMALFGILGGGGAMSFAVIVWAVTLRIRR